MYSEPSQSPAHSLVWKLGTGLGGLEGLRVLNLGRKAAPLGVCREIRQVGHSGTPSVATISGPRRRAT